MFHGIYLTVIGIIESDLVFNLVGSLMLWSQNEPEAQPFFRADALSRN